MQEDADTFSEIINTAALADYFFIAEHWKAGDDLEIIASRPVAAAYMALFEMLDIKCVAIIDETNREFIHLIFDTPEKKEKIDDFFSSFNFGPRIAYGVHMPDIYEGSSEPNMNIVDRYATIIHHYFTPNSGRPLHIPVGKNNPTGETLHAEYTSDGFQGFVRISYPSS